MKKTVVFPVIVVLICLLFCACSLKRPPNISGNGTGSSVSPHADELEGYWIAALLDENYDKDSDFFHTEYYIEFSDETILIRDYAKQPILETTFRVEDGGESTGYALLITLKDNHLCYQYADPYGTVNDLVFRDGQLYFNTVYTYNPDTVREYIAKPTTEGPFDDLNILDDQCLDALQGSWVDPDYPSSMLKIQGNTLSDCYIKEGEPPHVFDSWTFHVVSKKSNPDYIYLVGEDLISDEFGGYSQISFRAGILHTNIMVFDADWDTSMDFEKVEPE